MNYFRDAITTERGMHAIVAYSFLDKAVCITRMVLGTGKLDHFDDKTEITSLANEIISVPVTIDTNPSSNVKVIGFLNNETLENSFELTEIGLYIRDPYTDEEILHSYTCSDISDFIPGRDLISFTKTIVLNTTISSTKEIKFEIDYKIPYVLRSEFEEIKEQLSQTYELSAILTHNLNSYPQVLVIESEYGYGLCGFGESSYGGTNGRKLQSTVEYLNRNSVNISVEKQYPPVKNITTVSNTEYVITFDDSALSLYVTLLVSNPSGNSTVIAAGSMPKGERIFIQTI